MRLKNIKLAGFKSFVDPTTVDLPSKLVAVVGPNGCGKSNVIDAVRWVMGESSAKYLRGESLADVIFNGSTGRKPVGQASIELNFDNSDASLGGQYAQYSEISIRREITRDGQSNYYLNGGRCRRRDITDIFLGTGLGPRSYAIIEQGTISRLIEAKPEDLRVYLEEAAGISKYKERRRETELRIQHTRDNLERLNDLRAELDKQLEHLQRQANAAKRYQTLREEERLLKAQLQALRWHVLHQQLLVIEQAIKEREIQLEASIAEQRALDAELERQKQSHHDVTEQHNQVQSEYYRLGAEITRLEQTLQHHRERRQELLADQAQLVSAVQEAQQLLQEDNQRAEKLGTELAALTPEFAEATATANKVTQALVEAEQAQRVWQAEWDTFNQEVAQHSQQAQIEQAKIQHLEQRLKMTQQRIAQLEGEQGKFNPEQLSNEIVAIEQQSSALQQQQQELQNTLLQVQERLNTQRDHNQQHANQLDQLRSELQAKQGRYTSLETLQQTALGQKDQAIQEWLKQQNLTQQPRLAQALQVEEGWERAVETVLGAHLEAVCVNNMADIAEALTTLTKGHLALFDTDVVAQAVPQNGMTRILSKIKAPWPLDTLLVDIYAVETLADALALRTKLDQHQSIITRDGIWLGHNWLKITRDLDERAGILQRERELSTLQGELAECQKQIQHLQTLLQQGREQLQTLEMERDQKQQEVNELAAKKSHLSAQLHVKQGQCEHLQQRINQIQTEWEEQNHYLKEDNHALSLARSSWQQSLALLEQHSGKREALLQTRETTRTALETIREQAKVDKEKAHQLALRQQTLVTQIEGIEHNRERVQKQLENLEQRRVSLQEGLAAAESPVAGLNEQLTAFLSQRLQVEQQLSTARTALETQDQHVRELDKKRHAIEQAVLHIRQQLEQQRMEWQALQVRCATLHEQMTESGHDCKTLLDTMPAGAEELAWQEQLDKVTHRIERLGAINLAAIEEHAVQTERKTYLDAQNADLIEALDTLESAIRKIDRETRARFKETHEKVNVRFQELFPRMFGGGQAYLELTGEDLLDTGITVMAQPPGKRNSTISLLSGGEKALTAIALVFAIFQLNPAPFCMLDEVDAPLDDANIGRFCTLVQEMAQEVQFIFITHNKLAMEMAKHLIGVTMNEPGVSRLVAVDVEAAVALAEG